MTPTALSNRDFVRGLLFLAIGIAAATKGIGYGTGSTTAMGPGYFPLIIGLLLAAFGLTGVLRGITGTDLQPMPRLAWWPVACLACGVIGFGLLIERGGLLLSIFVLVSFAVLARRHARPLEFCAIYIGLAVIAGALFVFGMGSPFADLLPH
jgi:hypothetical protein